MFQDALGMLFGHRSSKSGKSSRRWHSRARPSEASARSRSRHGERDDERLSRSGMRGREERGIPDRGGDSGESHDSDSEDSWERVHIHHRGSPRPTTGYRHHHGRSEDANDAGGRPYRSTSEAVDEKWYGRERLSPDQHTRKGKRYPTTPPLSDSQDGASARGYDSETPQTFKSGGSPRPLRRSQTDPTTLDPRGTESDRRRRKSATRSSQDPPPRVSEVPNVGYVDIMAENVWLGGKIDRKLAETIAFSDLGHVEQLSQLSDQQRQGITRSYFQTLDDFDQRLEAETAKSRQDFEQIFDGMARASQRVLLYAAISGMLPVKDLATYKPTEDGLYLAQENALGTAFEDAQREFDIRSGANQRAWSAMRGGGLEDQGTRENGAVEILRKKYGSFRTHPSEPRSTTRTDSKYQDRTRWSEFPCI